MFISWSFLVSLAELQKIPEDLHKFRNFRKHRNSVDLYDEMETISELEGSKLLNRSMERSPIQSLQEKRSLEVSVLGEVTMGQQTTNGVKNVNEEGMGTKDFKLLHSFEPFIA